MSSVLSNFLGNAVLNSYFVAGTTYIALHVSDPTVLGNSGTEVVGGDYARELCDQWTAVGSKTTAINEQIVFDNLPACTVAYIAVWNAASGGNMLVRQALSTPIVVEESARMVIEPGDIAVTL